MEGLYYICSENKGAGQLCGYCTANLRLCFCICKKQIFSRLDSHGLMCRMYLLSEELENLTMLLSNKTRIVHDFSTIPISISVRPLLCQRHLNYLANCLNSINQRAASYFCSKHRMVLQFTLSRGGICHFALLKIPYCVPYVYIFLNKLVKFVTV